ncbi:11996_t:CDS:2, partial [Acaulospora morrowiae]
VLLAIERVMASPRYPGFHKYVTRAYIVVVFMIMMGLLLTSFVDDDISISSVLMIGVFLVFAYVIYWVIVRLNCYGTPLQRRRRGENNAVTIYSYGNRSSTSMRTSPSPRDTYQTFANYRFGAFANRLRSISSFASSITSQQRNNNNSEEESRNDDIADDQYIGDMEQTLTTPPPTYTKTLQDVGLPPPYISKTISLEDRTNNMEVENNCDIEHRSESMAQSRPAMFTSSSSLEDASGGNRESGIQMPPQSYQPSSNSHQQTDGNVVSVDTDHTHDSIPIGNNNNESRPPSRSTHPIPQPLSQISTDTVNNLGSPSSSAIINTASSHAQNGSVPPIPYSETTTNASTTSLSTLHISASTTSEQYASSETS